MSTPDTPLVAEYRRLLARLEDERFLDGCLDLTGPVPESAAARAALDALVLPHLERADARADDEGQRVVGDARRLDEECDFCRAHIGERCWNVVSGQPIYGYTHQIVRHIAAPPSDSVVPGGGRRV